MPPTYNFDWIRQSAKELGFGKIVVEFIVRDGVILRGEELERRRIVSLEESNLRKERDELI